MRVQIQWTTTVELDVDPAKLDALVAEPDLELDGRDEAVEEIAEHTSTTGAIPHWAENGAVRSVLEQPTLSDFSVEWWPEDGPQCGDCPVP